jgi:hypothetical protein
MGGGLERNPGSYSAGLNTYDVNQQELSLQVQG